MSLFAGTELTFRYFNEVFFKPFAKRINCVNHVRSYKPSCSAIGFIRLIVDCNDHWVGNNRAPYISLVCIDIISNREIFIRHICGSSLIDSQFLASFLCLLVLGNFTQIQHYIFTTVHTIQTWNWKRKRLLQMNRSISVLCQLKDCVVVLTRAFVWIALLRVFLPV